MTPHDRAAPPPDTRRHATPSHPPSPGIGTPTFALLADVVLIGVLVCVSALPVFSALAAIGAGCTLLRARIATDATVTVRHYLRLYVVGLRDPVGLAAPLALTMVAATDVLALLAGLPGGEVLGPILGLMLLTVAAAGLRGAARWSPSVGWRSALRDGVRRACQDRFGTVLLCVACGIAVVVVATAPVFALVMPGLLVLAALAVDHRAAVRAGPGHSRRR